MFFQRLKTAFVEICRKLQALIRSALDRYWMRVFYRLSVIVPIVIFLQSLDVGGIKTATDKRSHDWFMRGFNILDTWVPYFGNDVSVDFDKIVVLLWTEDSVNAIVNARSKQPLNQSGSGTLNSVAGQIWPIQYDLHSDLLYALADLNPSSVFLDFVFPTKRPLDNWRALLDAFSILPESDIPLFVGCSVGTEDCGFPELVKKIDDINSENGSQITFSSVHLPREAVSRHYSLKNLKCPEIAATDQNARPLPRPLPKPVHCLKPSELSKSAGKTVLLPSIALDMYREFRKTDPKSFDDIDETDAPMSLIWRYSAQPITKRYFGGGSAENTTPTALDEIIRLVYEFLTNTGEGAAQNAGPSVIPVRAVFANRDCWISDDKSADCPSPNSNFKPLVENPLEGKIVLVASSMLASGDFKSTPVAANQPSVIVHATALKNFIRFGDDYFRPFYQQKSDGKYYTVGAQHFSWFSIVFMALGLAIFHERRAKSNAMEPNFVPNSYLRLQDPLELGRAELIRNGVALFLATSFIAFIAGFCFRVSSASAVYAGFSVFVLGNLFQIQRPINNRLIKLISNGGSSE